MSTVFALVGAPRFRFWTSGTVLANSGITHPSNLNVDEMVIKCLHINLKSHMNFTKNFCFFWGYYKKNCFGGSFLFLGSKLVFLGVKKDYLGAQLVYLGY